jgi:uncharacterized phage protein (TIGR01671 family)
VREIKFRAWNKDVKDMSFCKEWSLAAQGDISLQDFWIENDSVIFMQFTGIKDKNGKEIYDGDVVNFEFGLGVVLWDDLTAQFKIEFDTDSDSLWLYCCKDSVLKKIGNIHENPELLPDR